MDVQSWLRRLGMEQYETAFRENDVNGDVLHSLTAEDLKDIGVISVGHRRKLLDAIATLSTSTATSEPTPDRSIPPSAILSSARSKDDAERRPITVMFCDLVGSTSLSARLDPEDWRDLVGAYLDEAARAVESFGGHVLKKLGDGLMALFGYPKAQENDAERAARAALAILRALDDLNARNAVRRAPALAARIGLESGPVVVDATGEVFGDAPNVAARVQAAAEPGTLLVTANVQRQVAGLFVAEDKGPHDLKGVPGRPVLYQLVRASGAGRRSAGRSPTPFVGREDELAVLLKRWDRARIGEGQLVGIIGEPGLGKSRLIDEFRASVAEAPHTWVEWSSSQLLQNTPLHPVAEWGRQRFGGVDIPVERRIADLEVVLAQVGLDPAEHAPLLAPLLDMPLPDDRAARLPPDEARRRQLAALVAWLMAGARQQPIVLAFEDLHWADPTTLDLMKTLAERGGQAPLLIVATARPEFRTPWAMRSHHGVISLAPLDRSQIRRMIGTIAERHALSKDALDGLSERTAGVPLFVEELTRLMLEGGVQTIPPTLQQSLAARLDRLGEAREVAQVGAVLGREFSRALLRAAADLPDAVLEGALEKLVNADLLFVDAVDGAYRFKHALIQDAAYDSLLKGRRQALHRRAAEALLATPGPRPELVAHHLTQSGQTDAAIDWWGRAGDEALRRSAFQEAISHLGRAIEMADREGAKASTGTTGEAGTGQRAKLHADYGRALMWSKGFGSEESSAAFVRAAAFAGSSEAALARFSTLDAECQQKWMRGEYAQAREIAESFLGLAEAEGGATEVGAARRALGFVLFIQGELQAARIVLTRALDDYSPGRDDDSQQRFARHTEVTSAAYLAAVEWLLGEPERARNLIERALRRGDELGQAVAFANAQFWLVVLETVRGDAPAAATATERLLRTADSQGIGTYAEMGRFYADWARGRLGDAEACARDLEAALTGFLARGMKVATTSYCALLADLEARANRPDLALSWVERGLAIMEETGERWWESSLHRARGEILLQRKPSDPRASEEAFRSAIAVAERQGARGLLLPAAIALARLLKSTNRLLEARSVIASALEGFTPTPEFPAIAEAQTLLGELEQSDLFRQDQRNRASYARALLAVEGYVSRAAQAAFQRAGGSEEGHFDDPQFQKLFYGHCLRLLAAGELFEGLEYAEAQLRRVPEGARSLFVPLARRLIAHFLFNLGRLGRARDELERAKADFDPDWAQAYLAVTPHDFTNATDYLLANIEWIAGDIDGALARATETRRRAEERGEPFTLAIVLSFLATLYYMADRAQETLEVSEVLAEVTSAHGISFYGRLGAVTLSWAKGRLGDPRDAIRAVRTAIDLRSQNGEGYFQSLALAQLSHLQILADDVEGALAALDEASAFVARTGETVGLARLLTLRGDCLLPSDTVAAEEAYRRALCVAREQGARTFELKASLPLARLQADKRSMEARDILARALEGFAPSSELPEIAEAQNLLREL